MIQATGQPTNRAIVVFDGDCGVCTSSAELLTRIDTGRNFDLVSLHDARAKALLPDRTHEDLMREMHVVESDGRWYAGADAVRAIARRLPVLWPAAVVLHLPGTLPLWRRLYAAIAQRRYRIAQRLGCDNQACAVHLRN